MQPKLDGWVDALGHLQLMGNRKAARRVMAWVRGPQWILSSVTLESYRTPVRGTIQQHDLKLTANSAHGEISAR